MKVFWLNDGLHIKAETQDERLALEIVAQSLGGTALAPAPEPRLGATRSCSGQTSGSFQPTPESRQRRDGHSDPYGATGDPEGFQPHRS